MPKQKDLKRRVRSRMKKTGESYTAARTRVIQKKAGAKPATKQPRPAEFAGLAGYSDETVKAKTGCTWERWVWALDRAGAASMPHKDIARYVHEKYKNNVSAWWAQTVTVGYERIRGLRQKGQRRGGGFVVNKSKTYPASITKLYQAFSAQGRKRWLGEGKLTVKKATPKKSMRLSFEDGTPVEVHFWAKGSQKSQLQLQHSQRPSKSDADKIRAFWTQRLAALGKVLAPKPK